MKLIKKIIVFGIVIMKLIKKIIVFGSMFFVLSILVFLLSMYIYVIYEWNTFFNNKEDMTWASQYQGKKIDFCAQEDWADSIVVDEEVLQSPSGNFFVKRNPAVDVGRNFAIYKGDSSTPVLVSIESHDLGGFQIKWALNETYILYLVPEDLTANFSKPEIYIGNLKTGKVIHLAGGTQSHCVLYDDEAW